MVTGAWSSSPARGLAPARTTPTRCSREPGKPRAPGRLEEQWLRLQLPPRPPRPPGLRARVTAERLLKGTAAAPAPAPAPRASDPRPKWAGLRGRLRVLELEFRKGLEIANTRGLLEDHLLRGYSVRSPDFPSASSKLTRGESCESQPPHPSVPGLAT